MNWIDLIIVIILALALFRGFTQGFVKEVASLAALIIGIWGAIKFSSFTAAKLYDYFDMTGPLAFREMVMPVDFSEGLKWIDDSFSEAKIRIESGFIFWEMDYATLDLTPDVAVGIDIVSPASAINESGKDVYKFIARDDKKYYIQSNAGNEVELNFSNSPRGWSGG